jgi:hypothetical protein
LWQFKQVTNKKKIGKINYCFQNHYIEGAANTKKKHCPVTKFHVKKVSRVQMKAWVGKALGTVNCCDFLKRRLMEHVDS